jgi:mutator protein MutT
LVKIIDVAAAIIHDNKGKILICRRGSGGSCAYLWEFPGGKREAGETMQECVIRECREELTVNLKTDVKYAEFFYSYPDRDIHFCFYLAEIISGAVKKMVHSEIKWVFPQELHEYEFCPADRELIQRLCHG